MPQATCIIDMPHMSAARHMQKFCHAASLWQSLPLPVILFIAALLHLAPGA